MSLSEGRGDHDASRVGGALKTEGWTQALPQPRPEAQGTAAVDSRTLEIVEHRRATENARGRGWLVARMLVVADVLGLTIAFLLAQLLTGPAQTELLAFVATLPLWVLGAKLYGLYRRDAERIDHTTADDVAGIFHLSVVGAAILFLALWAADLGSIQPAKPLAFSASAIVLLPLLRACARSLCRRDPRYLQNTVIVGAGEVGQLVARKLLRHPE